MMQQYFKIKDEYKDYLLFYRLGDFYEMFFDDAVLASRLLELTLTGRDCGEEERAPMCGVPYHSVDTYIGKLVSLGYKIAICEQMEDPASATGLVKREVIRIITPGTLVESDLLDEKANNYICSLYKCEDGVGLAFADVSTGEFSCTAIPKDHLYKLTGEIGAFAPSELIMNVSENEIQETLKYLKVKLGTMVTPVPAEYYDRDSAVETLKSQFAEVPADIIEQNEPARVAASSLMHYLSDMQKGNISYIDKLRYYSDGQYLEIDLNSKRNLELCQSIRSREKKGTLLWVLDKTRSAAGARLLRSYLEKPLCNAYLINKRLSAVEELKNNVMLRGEISDAMSGVLDVERILTRVVYSNSNARDIRAIAQTAEKASAIKALLKAASSDELVSAYHGIDAIDDIRLRIESELADELPVSVREGGFIRKGYNEEVDRLRGIVGDAKHWLLRMEEQEREQTGIRNLRIGYNRVFGYYIEVSRSNIGDVPERYLRKQTLTTGERYITPELKELENEILGGSEKLCELEYKLFTELVEYVSSNMERIQKMAARLAVIDVYASLAEAADKNGYVRPEVDVSDSIEITDGRHPIVELFGQKSFFVPNDTKLNCGDDRFMLITGPNMAGKSTYMRQVALITIMAQIGSFVPAKYARIGIVDKIFTRVGASDDLAMGQSTFMLEMSEVAYILHNATKKSLILYDEIGRGTSTYDGMSIAKAVAEYTAGKKLGAKTLFATHYHELTVLEDLIPGVKNYSIAAKKRGDDVIFLRRIIRGAADDSFGIEVAKLAGVSGEVVKRAKVVLAELNSAEPKPPAPEKPMYEPHEEAISLDDIIGRELRDKLNKTDLNILSPIESLNLLYELKKTASGTSNDT
ncbi:MAG: DNA mismatch repair protein MutS [Clostridia bacterium]|nr:DNA mismatch repair protein MutS [Clostridia bacterium]